MLKTVTDAVTSALRNAGITEVYTAFDNIPVKGKGGSNGLFAVVSAGALKTSAPLYSPYTVFVPFEAEAELSLLAPLKTGLYSLFCCFEEAVLPALTAPDGPCISVKGITAGRDSNLSRLVMKIKLSVSGISRIERSGTT